MGLDCVTSDPENPRSWRYQERGGEEKKEVTDYKATAQNILVGETLFSTDTRYRAVRLRVKA